VKNKDHNNNQLKRRSFLKAIAGVPVVGLLGYQVLQKLAYEDKSNEIIIKELGLDIEHEPIPTRRTSSKNELLRVGIIGYGERAQFLAHGLGYMHPTEVENRIKNNELDSWLAQDNLNIAITGICEVFDMRAVQGLETASNNVHPDGWKGSGIPVKRYKHYHDLLNSPNIDAVIIATPEHQHAQMVIDAVAAGKHVYCEKSFTRTEDELYKAYDAVKNSNIVFQLGHQISQNPEFKKAKEIIKKNIIGDISLIETTTNRNTPHGAWIRHLNENGKPKPGSEKSIDWKQWLGSRPYKPFSIDRFYNWTKWFDYGTGMLGQLFTHEFDAVNQLLRMGIPDTVSASGGIYHWKDNREIPDVLNVSFEYPKQGFTLLYSASLRSSRSRGRVFMGRDGSMELGNTVKLTIDKNSQRFKQQIENGIIIPDKNIVSFGTANDVDAISSATTKYYASRGLTSTIIEGKSVDLTYLHLREWVNCIRNGGETSANIERSFEEGVAVQMAQKAYLEKRQVRWDPLKNRII